MEGSPGAFSLRNLKHGFMAWVCERLGEDVSSRYRVTVSVKRWNIPSDLPVERACSSANLGGTANYSFVPYFLGMKEFFIFLGVSYICMGV